MAPPNNVPSKQADFTVAETSSEDRTAARLAQLEAIVMEQAALIKELKASPAAAKASSKSGKLPAEFKGAKTYRVTQPHYRKGQYFEVGQHITVIDERPSKTWVLLEAAVPEKKFVDAPVQPMARASDQQL